MQNRLLAHYPSDQLRVYAVWLPMLGGDAREEWNGTTMPDTRITHFWDGDRLVGQWFANHADGYEGIAWDAYYLYGPEATWETVPGPLEGSGGTIIGERDMLELQMSAVLEK
jgi:hypothetical protein